MARPSSTDPELRAYQDWLRDWQEAGLLEPTRPGQRIRSWQLREPWLAWVIGQLERQE